MATHAVGPATRRVFLATVIAQIVIVVTGGAVRLTGSGLGCPTWPQCAEDSYVPLPAQSEGLHKWIEFGNRLLTFVLALVVLIAIGAAIRHVRRVGRSGRALLFLALAQLAGIVAQAVLGGITVLTDLHPIPVAGHFILSAVLIAVAATLHMRSSASEQSEVLRPDLRRLIGMITVVAALVVVLGTIVTGSGPHAGDQQARRFGFDPRTVSWLHADTVILFLGLLFALLFAVRITGGSASVRRGALLLLAISVAQGAVGYLQYFTGLPEVVVGLHLLGACLVWLFAWRLYLLSRPRPLPF